MHWVAGWLPNNGSSPFCKRPRFAMSLPAGQVWASGFPADEVKSITTPDQTLTVLLIGTCYISEQDHTEVLRTARQSHWSKLMAWPGSYIAVVQQSKRTTVLGDLAGNNTIYYTRLSNGYLWSSAATPLAAAIGAAPNLPALVSDMVFNRLPPYMGWSPYSGIQTVPPGDRLELRPGRAITKPWHKIRTNTDWEAATSTLYQALTHSVEARVTASQKLSAYLSGGFDSSNLAIMAARQKPLDAITYTDQWLTDGDDLAYARAVAADYPSISHHVMDGRQEELYLTELDERGLPFVDLPSTDLLVYRYSEYLTQHLVELGSTDHMCGEGGDRVIDASRSHVASLYAAGARLDAVRWATSFARRLAVSPWEIVRAMRELAKTSYADADLLATIQARLYQMAAEAKGEAFDVGQMHDWSGLRHSLRHFAVSQEVSRRRGVRLHLPYYDAAVVEAGLSVPGHKRLSTPTQFKPLLAAAFGYMWPAALLQRTTKGNYVSSSFRARKKNQSVLHQIINESRLVEAGILNGPAISDSFDRILAGVAPWGDMALDKFWATELWLGQLLEDTSPERWWEENASL